MTAWTVLGALGAQADPKPPRNSKPPSRPFCGEKSCRWTPNTASQMLHSKARACSYSLVLVCAKKMEPKRIVSLTTHSLTYSLTHSLTTPHPHSLTHSLTHSLSHTHSHYHPHSLTHTHFNIGILVLRVLDVLFVLLLFFRCSCCSCCSCCSRCCLLFVLFFCWFCCPAIHL